MGATPAPLQRTPNSMRWVVRHAAGVTRFARTANGVAQELAVFVAREAPVKFSLLTLTNLGREPRLLSLFAYNEWQLGPPRKTGPNTIATELDAGPERGPGPRPLRRADASRWLSPPRASRLRSATGDRLEFLGRNGSLARAAGFGRPRLLESFGVGLDPCAALQAVIELAPGRNPQRGFPARPGQRPGRRPRSCWTASPAQAGWRRRPRSCGGWRSSGTSCSARSRSSTPDDSIDLLFNRWLLYQNLVCRLWTRSGYYQAGGAYGFRDQLQDVLALLFTRPDLTREHLLRAAARQFVEGDVQHWWLPDGGQGIRTRCSDDLLWLAYAAAEYATATGDQAVWEEQVRFLEGPLLEEGDQEVYGTPKVSEEEGSLFEHCARALDRSLAVGAHGLPLMGSCDWNDGYNKVGAGGRGESVFVGFFLHHLLGTFAPWAEERGETARAGRWRHARQLLGTMLEQSWDGDWYRRAYFDDGTPLGSAQNDEGRIDSVAQSWAVLSGAAPEKRAERAMEPVRSHLVKRSSG